MPKEKLFVLFAFIALAIIAYRNCFGIFIPGDNYSLFYLFENGGLEEATNNLGPFYFSVPVIFFVYKLIGASSFLWVSISLGLHVINSFLVYSFASKMFYKESGKNNFWVPVFSGLFFLLSPYQTEAALWIPTDIQILLPASLCLCCLLLLLDYFSSKQKSTLYLLHIAFLFAVFSFETAFVLPLLSCLLFIFYKTKNGAEISFRNFFREVLVVQAGIIIFYFLVTKAVFGTWLWHGGNFESGLLFAPVAGNLLKYCAKFFLFYRYLPITSLDGLFRQLFTLHGTMAVVSILFLLALIIFFVKNKRSDGKFLAWLFSCFLVALLPVLPLDSSFLTYLYPDRYGYLPSVFFYIFAASCIFFLLKRSSLAALAGYAVLCWLLLSKTIAVWNADNEYCAALVQNYKPFIQYNKVYVLNMPTYYKGAAAFRSAFAETISMKYDASPAENIHVISGCYQESSADSLTSVSITGNLLTVSGPKMKTPFFSTNGGWAKSYETEAYKVSFSPDGCSYTLAFKQDIPKNSAFICTSNNTWKKAL